MTLEGFPVEKENATENGEKRFHEICSELGRIISEAPGAVNTSPLKGFEQRFGEKVQVFLSERFESEQAAIDAGHDLMREIREPFVQIRENMESVRSIRRIQTGESEMPPEQKEMAHQESASMDKMDLVLAKISNDVLGPHVKAHRK